MITDLTKGNPSNILWKFTLPMFVSVIFQQLYNIAFSICTIHNSNRFWGTVQQKNAGAYQHAGKYFYRCGYILENLHRRIHFPVPL